jgi:hypothetical protein
MRRIPLTKSFDNVVMKQLPAMLLGLGLAALPLSAVPQSDNRVETTSTVTPLAAEAPRPYPLTLVERGALAPAVA